MFPQLYTAASGMIAGERNVELTSNNLANVNTPAYEPDRPIFATYLAHEVTRRNPNASAPVSVQLAASWHPTEPGTLRATSNPLDLALSSEGWFRIGTPSGERLTRAGSFTRTADGQLVNHRSLPVLDDKGQPIQLPEGEIAIAQDGTISVGGAQVAKLGVATAPVKDLTREGDTLWSSATPPVPVDPTRVSVAQGYLEASAVNVTQELVSLLQAQRMFQMQQRLVDLTGNTLARRALELGETR